MTDSGLSTRSLIHVLCTSVALAALLGCNSEAPKSYLFDFGSGGLAAEHAVVVDPGDVFTPSRGWGWMDETPRTAVDRENLARSRDALTRDYVEADSLSFRVEAAPGEWRLAFLSEAGIGDVSTLEFAINGVPQVLEWTQFDPQAEPREDLRAHYRMYMAPVTVGGDGLELTWRDETEPVRLIAVHLYPRGSDADQALQRDTLALAKRYFEGYRGWEWARQKTGLSMFARYEQAVSLYDALLGDVDFQKSELFVETLFDRARLNHWRYLEQHGERTGIAARRDLKRLQELGLDTPLLRMYLGEKIDEPDACDDLAPAGDAPEWAVMQREVLCRTHLVAHWWIDERQADNGELGGKIADDVEMTRWWAIPYLAGDDKVEQGWLKLSDAVYSSDLMENGYTRKPIDVEHSSEPTADTAMVLALSGEPDLIGRLEPTIGYFLDNWTVATGEGRRLFKSAWFGATQIDVRPPRDRDLPMTARAVKPVRYVSFATGNEDAERGLVEWARAWADAVMSTDKGKPVGIVPASIRAADGAINGDEPTWYRANMFWPYFEWESGNGVQIYDALLYAYELSGDEDLNRALLTAFDLVAALIRGEELPGPDAGGPRWAAKHLAGSGFYSIWSQWRLLTGDTRYDDILLERGGAYLRYRLSGDEQLLANAGDKILQSVRYNFPLKTSEALFTDRVYITERGDRGTSSADLVGMLTGAVAYNSPYFAVTWTQAIPGFTALVTSSEPKRLVIDTWLFGDEPAEVSARLWRLQPGNYTLKITVQDGVALEREIVVEGRGPEVSFRLAANQRQTISITPRSP